MDKREDDKSYAVCSLADEPRYTVGKLSKCNDCGAELWRSASTPPTDVDVCMPCGMTRMRAEGSVKFEPLTQRQRTEIGAALLFRKGMKN